MESTHKLFCIFAAGASFVLTGCSDKSTAELPIENITIIEEGNARPAEKVESSQPTAIFGSGGSMSELLTQTFTNIVEPNKAKHVIVACEDLDMYESELLAAYQRGCIITITDPDAVKVDEWCAANGMLFPGDPTATDDSSLISFNRKAASMSIQKKGHFDTIIDEGEVPLVIFTDWLDEILNPMHLNSDFRSRDIKKRVAPQKVSHVFPIQLPVDVLRESGWGVPDNVTLYTTASLTYEIYPLHSFADNATFTGDFYGVEAELTIHNGNIYNGRWQYTQGSDSFESCGFYLEECGLSISLLERGSGGLVSSVGQTFVAGPTPDGSNGSSYQSGFDWTFDGWLSGGNGLESSTPIPLQEGGWTWDNKATHELSALKIAAISESGSVSWQLGIDNLPATGKDKIPEIASGDLKFHYSFIWALPQAKDDTSDIYYMQVGFNPVYRWTRLKMSDTRLEYKEITPEVAPFRFMLIPPSRIEGQRI